MELPLRPRVWQPRGAAEGEREAAFRAAEARERLAEAAEALVAYLDTSAEGETGVSSPQEEVETWLSRQGYHLASVERAQMPDAEAQVTGVAELATTAARSRARCSSSRSGARALMRTSARP